MGAGSWDYNDWRRAYKEFEDKTASQIYTQPVAKVDFLPHGIIRESCDGTDHPFSTPIMLGLDVTGSMDRILESVIKKINVLIEEIYGRKTITDPQVLCAAIGDSRRGDRYPLQVSQFESDIRIVTQLKDMYKEGGGGGNGFESYPLLWYFAKHKTRVDSYKKRRKKGFIFTIGDDGWPEKLEPREIKYVFGDNITEPVDTKKLLAEVNREWEVFHLCLMEGGTFYRSDTASWENMYREWQSLLGERAIKVTDYTKIPEIIVSLIEVLSGKSNEDVINSWDGSTSLVVKDALKGMSTNRMSSSGELIEF